MAPVWFHPEGDALPGSGGGGATPAGNAPGRMGPGHRLNLLLSYAGWSPDPWVERIPTLLEPMGVVSHRVGSGRQAEELIKRRSIHIAVVDMGLPLDADVADDQAPEFAEGGARLLELLARLDEPPPVVAVTRPRAHRDVTREINAALRLGAFAVVSRPREPGELDVMLDVLRKVLQRHWQGRWPEGSGGA